MKKIYVSIVSHGHGKMISELRTLETINKFANVVIKNNCKDPLLVDYCQENNINVVDEKYGLGFGANNNVNYLYCRDIGMKDDDFFLVLNPDVYIEESEFIKFFNFISIENIDFSTINLFLDKQFSSYDSSIRKFPTLKTFSLSFLGFGNKTLINKADIKKVESVDWGAGSFLCFKSELYKKLKGFDESYFMYCEDVDISYRSFIMGNKLSYIPSIKAVHLAQHSNRNIFSKHFYWHTKSALMFLFFKALNLTDNKKSRV